MFQKILVAVDASESGDSLISAAGALAARTGAELMVFHVRTEGEDGPMTVAEVARERLVDRGIDARAHSLPAHRRKIGPCHRRSGRGLRRRPHRHGVAGAA